MPGADEDDPETKALAKRQMLEPPFRFESTLTPDEFQKVGQLALRWSAIEHIAGNVLRMMLRLSPEEGLVIVFPLSFDQRLKKMKELTQVEEFAPDIVAAIKELKTIMMGVQYVRNGVVHSTLAEDPDDGHIFHNHSKSRRLTKAQVFDIEELTNYAAHLIISLRYKFGVEGVPTDFQHPIPARPKIPEFLLEQFSELRSLSGDGPGMLEKQ